MADKINVTIRIDKAEAGRIEEIVRALKASGLDRVESHPRFMIINGSASRDALDALRKIKGVASVRQDRSYKPQKP
jgi:hypothetical protein